MAAVHKRGPWGHQEDTALLNLVNEHGAFNWVQVSASLGTRTPKQCRERYHQNLKSSLRHEPITPAEGEMIEELVKTIGKRWAEIARRLSNRSDNAVKNWWNGNQNRRRKRREGQRSMNDGRWHPGASTGDIITPSPRSQIATMPPPFYHSAYTHEEPRRSSWVGHSMPSPSSIVSTDSELPPNYIATPAQFPFGELRESLELPPLRYTHNSEKIRLPSLNEFQGQHQLQPIHEFRSAPPMNPIPRAAFYTQDRPVSHGSITMGDLPTAPTTPENQQQWQQPTQANQPASFSYYAPTTRKPTEPAKRDSRLSLSSLVH